VLKSKSAPLNCSTMLTDIIPHNKTKSQSPELELGTVQKLPSAGSIKVELQEAWAEFIKRFEPFDLYVTLTFKEPKHPESADTMDYTYKFVSLWQTLQREKKGRYTF